MAIESILSQIDAEIARLTQIRSLLSGSTLTAGKAASSVKKAGLKVKVKQTRVLSPEARKRIADAQRRRWAAQKAKSK